MFTIDEMGGIHVSRGDSIGLSTQPFIETDDGIAAIPIEGDNCVIFTVKSRYSGRTIIKRILTEEDVVDGALSLQITTDETDIEPYGYEYSFMYVPDRNDQTEAYTYAQGGFEIMPSVSKVEDLTSDTEDESNGND